MLISKKKKLRKLYSSIRYGIDKESKSEFDRRILSIFINSYFVGNHDLFLIYVSVGNEVDTYGIIEYLLKNNKSVAIPFCDGNKMFFCRINSLNELIPGRFGIPTVRNPIFINEKDLTDSLCIMPALSVDLNGNRLGYGGGFYDRFLAENKVETLVLCYERCLSSGIPADSFDVPVKNILTENNFKKLLSQEVSTYE